MSSAITTTRTQLVTLKEFAKLVGVDWKVVSNVSRFLPNRGLEVVEYDNATPLYEVGNVLEALKAHCRSRPNDDVLARVLKRLLEYESRAPIRQPSASPSPPVPAVTPAPLLDPALNAAVTEVQELLRQETERRIEAERRAAELEAELTKLRAELAKVKAAVINAYKNIRDVMVSAARW